MEVTEPENLIPVFDEPGSLWMGDTEKCEQVTDWLFERRQHEVMHKVASAALPAVSSHREEAEDAVGEFYVSRFSMVARNYNPHKNGSVRFWPYYIDCLKRYCWSEYKPPLIRRGTREETLQYDSDKGAERDLPDSRAGLESEAIAAAMLRAVEECLSQLPPKDETLIRLKVLDDLSWEDVSLTLLHSSGVTEQSRLRKRGSRLLPRLAECMESKGWRHDA